MKKAFLFGLAITLLFVSTRVEGSEKMHYTNEKGGALTKEQYDYITKYISEDDLHIFNDKEMRYLLENVAIDGVELEEKYIKSTVESGVVEEEYIDAEKMEQWNYGQNRPIESLANSRVATFSYEEREDEVITEMKQISMKMYQVGPSVKKVYLVCTWLSLPKYRSFDVIGMRVGSKAVMLNTFTSENFSATQYYDDKSCSYSYSGSNLKKCDKGFGVSMNLSDTAKTSLKMEVYANFGTAADGFTVYGSYQHATDDITLNKSHKYSISSSGMGGVFKFNWLVKDSYDNTPGLSVKGSFDGL